MAARLTSGNIPLELFDLSLDFDCLFGGHCGKLSIEPGSRQGDKAGGSLEDIHLTVYGLPGCKRVNLERLTDYWAWLCLVLIQPMLAGIRLACLADGITARKEGSAC